MTGQIVCIGGNKYEIVDDESTSTGSPISGGNVVAPSAPTVDMSTTEAQLTRLVDIEGGGNLGGGYRSISLTIPAHEKGYGITLGLHATQIIIRSDQGLTITLNSPSADNIFIAANEFPFGVSDLKLNESINNVYVTTGDNDTNIKILAFGLVG